MTESFYKNSLPVLHPKLRDQFYVQVTEADGTYNKDYDIFTSQIVSIDIGSELLITDENCQHKTNRVIMWLHDDATCQLTKIIRALQKTKAQVNIDVYLLNGCSQVLEIFSYKLATPEALQYSMLSYEPIGDSVSLIAKMPKPVTSGYDSTTNIAIEGSTYSSKAHGTCMKLLQFFFVEYEHVIVDEPTIITDFMAKA